MFRWEGKQAGAVKPPATRSIRSIHYKFIGRSTPFCLVALVRVIWLCWSKNKEALYTISVAAEIIFNVVLLNCWYKSLTLWCDVLHFVNPSLAQMETLHCLFVTPLTEHSGILCFRCSCTFVKCAVGVTEKSTVGSLSKIFPTSRNSGAKIVGSNLLSLVVHALNQSKPWVIAMCRQGLFKSACFRNW